MCVRDVFSYNDSVLSGGVQGLQISSSMTGSSSQIDYQPHDIMPDSSRHRQLSAYQDYQQPRQTGTYHQLVLACNITTFLQYTIVISCMPNLFFVGLVFSLLMLNCLYNLAYWLQHLNKLTILRSGM